MKQIKLLLPAIGFFLLPSLASVSATTPPSITLTAVSGNQQSDSALTIKVGDTFTVSGTPMNVKESTQFPGYAAGGAWFFGSLLDGACENTPFSLGTTWSLTCTPKSVGTATVYFGIY